MARQSRVYPFEEGDGVAIGLPSGGYALVVIARVSRKKQLMLVYAFAPRYPTLPAAEMLTQLKPEKAIATAFVDLYKIGERMEQAPPAYRLGRLPHWKRDEWRVLPGIEIISIEPQPYLVFYNDDTLEEEDKFQFPVEALRGKRYLTVNFIIWDSFVRLMDKYVENPPDMDEWVGEFYRRHRECVELSRQILETIEREKQEGAMMKPEDRLALQQALESGLPPDEPQWFEHYLYFSKRRQAEQAAKELRQAGYEVDLDRSGSEWRVLAQHQLLPDEGALEEAIEYLEALVERYAGEYDGWGVAIEASKGEQE
jgi:regulator of RNase E activity RraB